MNHLNLAIHAADQDVIPTEEYCHTCGNRLHENRLSNDGPAACPECGVLSRLLRAMGRGDLPFLDAEAVLPDLKAAHKDDVIREIVESLVHSGSLADGDTDSIVATLLRREELGSTGIGEGVALPHTKHPALAREVGTVAWSATGIDFGSLDGEPVHLIVLLLSPIDEPSNHIRALAKIAAFIRPRRT